MIGVQDFENKKINAYWPNENAPAESAYWIRWKTTFLNNQYYYKRDIHNAILYNYEETNWQEENYMGDINHMDIIVGENNTYHYVIATKSVKILENNVSYNIGGVSNGSIDSGLIELCGCRNQNCIYAKEEKNIQENIRPVVVIPWETRISELE